MKKLEKKIYEVKNPNGTDTAMVSTVLFIKSALHNQKLNANGQAEGFSMEDVIIRVNIDKAVSGLSKDIIFEEEEAKALIQMVKDTRWATFDEALSDFFQCIQNMETYDINA